MEEPRDSLFTPLHPSFSPYVSGLGLLVLTAKAEFSASKALHEIARWRLCRHIIRGTIRAEIHFRELSEGGAAGTCLTSHFGVPLAEASPPLDQIPGNHVSFLYTDGPVACVPFTQTPPLDVRHRDDFSQPRETSGLG